MFHDLAGINSVAIMENRLYSVHTIHIFHFLA